MRAALLAIGDELVGGLTTDTNSGFLAQALRTAGIDCCAVRSVPDDPAAIDRALRHSLEDAPIVITTGGLGPTADDLTTECVASLAGRPLELDEDSLSTIRERFRDRGLEMPANNRKQALFPAGATVLPNALGTAPAFLVRLDQPRESVVASLPGVPREMRRLAEEQLIPWLAQHFIGRHLASRVFSTVGLSESKLDELLEGAIDDPDVRVSFRAAFPRLQVRLSVAEDSPEAAETRLARFERVVRDRLGRHIYALGDVGLEDEVGRLLKAAEATVATAESCTGGLIGDRITDVAGSSSYYLGGVVAYSNDLKMQMLRVRPETLAQHGAVSDEVVAEMARGIRERTGADFGVATSGIAGPGGGTPEKPVGTVAIAVVGRDAERVRTFQFGARSRGWVKAVTAQTALDQLRLMLLESESD